MSLQKSDLILLVEDDDIDAMMIERTLTRLRPDIRLLRAENGELALAALKDQRPDLIVMDIRMPRMDGRETLQRLKNDESLCDIPVVMMSTSASNDDVNYCYRNHANAYMVKAMGSKSSREAIENLLNFWFDTATR